MKLERKAKEKILLLLGIILFMFFYYAIKDQFQSSVMFVVVALVYLIILKWLSKFLSNKNSINGVSLD